MWEGESTKNNIDCNNTSNNLSSYMVWWIPSSLRCIQSLLRNFSPSSPNTKRTFCVSSIRGKYSRRSGAEGLYKKRRRNDNKNCRTKI